MARPVNDRLLAGILEREKRVRALVARREALLDEADAIGAEIERLLPVSPRLGTRASRLHLVDLLAILLDGRAMRVKEAAASARRAGYPTRSAHLAVQVQMALSRSGRFERVARGRYTAKA
jgi:hypothetical protein